jgi:hypothetical protein
MERRILEALDATARGPRQNAVFAMWIVLRLCDGLLPPDALSPAARRRRLAGAERRLTSLTLPGAIRRSLTAAFRELGSGNASAGAVVLHQLVAPAREAIGPMVADALAAAAREAREAARFAPAPPLAPPRARR